MEYQGNQERRTPMTNPTRNVSLRLFMDQYEIEEHEVAQPVKKCGQFL
jgi:hypothetical protein